jgi:hypothetical protein
VIINPDYIIYFPGFFYQFVIQKHIKMDKKINNKLDKAINKLNEKIASESFKNGIVYHFRMTDKYITRIKLLCRLKDNYDT